MSLPLQRLCRNVILRREPLPTGRQGRISIIDSVEMIRFFIPPWRDEK